MEVSLQVDQVDLEVLPQEVLHLQLGFTVGGSAVSAGSSVVSGTISGGSLFSESANS